MQQPQSRPAGAPWPHWPELERSLTRDGELGEQLEALLGDERAALEQRDYARFEQLVGRKQQLVTALEQNADLRRRWLATKGFATEAAALARAGQEVPALAETWRQLAGRWQRCQDANQVNEQICARTRVVVTRMLEILRGDSGGGTYDASGAARRLEQGRRLGDA